MIETESHRSPYIIRGGSPGRERLRVLTAAVQPMTLALLDEAGIPPGARCLDVGCGGGDVTLELADLTVRLQELAGDPGVVISMPRIVRAWGSRP